MSGLYGGKNEESEPEMIWTSEKKMFRCPDKEV